MKFQFGTSKWGGTRKLPKAFTEQGIAMLSSVLRSKRAIQVNIAIMRAFVTLREFAAGHKVLAAKLEQLERKVGGHDGQTRSLFDAIRQLMEPPLPNPDGSDSTPEYQEKIPDPFPAVPRFIASQMVSAILDVTRIDSSTVGTKDKYVFRTTGTVVKFTGHTIVYLEGVDKELPSQKPKADQEEDDSERQLPALSEGDQLRRVEQEGQTVQGVLSKQHFTQPPPRYNEALLIKELEEKGIGRPPTYAAIISTIQDRKYVEKTEGRLVPTETGRTVNDFLMKGFPELINVDFTSQLEEQIDEVEEGTKPWVTAVRDFYTPFTKELERAKTIPGLKDTVEPPTDIPCEKCGKMMEIKWGRNGKFLACPGYKDDPPCKNTQNFEKLSDGTIKIVPKLELTTDQKCDKCASLMVVKTGRFGKFIACSAYPQCKTTKPLALGVKCPQPECGGDLVQKRTRKGRSFFACGNYPKCEYALWDRPVPKVCPTCQAPFLVERVSKQDGRSVQCRNQDCGYREAWCVTRMPFSL